MKVLKPGLCNYRRGVTTLRTVVTVRTTVTVVTAVTVVTTVTVATVVTVVFFIYNNFAYMHGTEIAKSC